MKFKLSLNLKHAIATGILNALSAFMFFNITNPYILIPLFVLGMLGGSINDLMAFKRNQMMRENENLRIPGSEPVCSQDTENSQ